MGTIKETGNVVKALGVIVGTATAVAGYVVFSPPDRSGRFTLERIVVHSDGDSFADGDGDFVWEFSVNGQIVVEQTEEQNLGNGQTVRFNTEVELQFRGGAPILVTGHVTDRDGGLSGTDDRIDFELEIHPGLGVVRSGSVRPAEGEDPDVEFFYSLEIPRS